MTRSDITLVRLLLLSLSLYCSNLLAQAQAGEQITVIGSASHSTNSISREELARIYLGKKLFWEDGTRIIAVNLAADHPCRKRFSRLVLGVLPEEMQEYWNTQYFHGISPPYVLSSEEAVLRFVAETPGTIGYLCTTATTPQVKVLLLLPAEEEKR